MNQPPPNTAPPQNPPQRKQRHGCLTSWLILIIAVNLTASILVATVDSSSAGVAGWVIGVDAALGLWAVVCAVALFLWKKWGFYGFILGAVISIALNVAIGSYLTAFTPLISVAILWGVLQIGGPNKGWTQLE